MLVQTVLAFLWRKKKKNRRNSWWKQRNHLGDMGETDARG